MVDVVLELSELSIRRDNEPFIRFDVNIQSINQYSKNIPISLGYILEYFKCREN